MSTPTIPWTTIVGPVKATADPALSDALSVGIADNDIAGFALAILKRPYMGAAKILASRMSAKGPPVTPETIAAIFSIAEMFLGEGMRNVATRVERDEAAKKGGATP